MPLRLRYSQRLEGIEEALQALNQLVARNMLQAKRKRYPALYKSGIRYVREPSGVENWQTLREAHRTKQADCEDLAAIRCAELRAAGEKARIVLRVVRPGLVHILVKRANGKLEDPSKRLGMKGNG